jgi:carboxypeptidase PM20D1
MIYILIKALLAVPIVIIVIMIVRTIYFTSKQVKADPADDFTVNTKNAVRNLSGAIQIPTISFENEADFKGAEFFRFHKYLEQTYPQLHKTLKKEIVNSYSLLYTWPGIDKNLQPIILLAHMDVVPVEEKSISQWTHNPFAGSVADGYIWGRGSLDNKASLLGIMEAIECLVEKGFQPKRTIYIVSGHDEELGGIQGAMKIAVLLKERGVTPEYVLDEAMVITEGMMKGVSSRVGLIGIAEKGYLSMELIAVAEGGHAAMPSRETAVGLLCKAVDKLISNPFPARIEGPTKYLFDYAGREMPFLQRMVFANLWLTEGLLKSQLQKVKTTNALIRTTIAPTMLEGSNKDNVLPNVARAVFNFRILPGDTTDSVFAHVRKVVNDPRIEVKPLTKQIQGASPVAGIDSKSFFTIQKTIRQVFPDVIVAPSLVLAASDSRHFAVLTRDVYRFVPLILKSEDMDRLHGINERIAVDNYLQIIKFYRQLIINSQI